MRIVFVVFSRSFVTVQQSLSGFVVDPAGVPLPGVNVVIKGSILELQLISMEISQLKPSSDVLIFSLLVSKTWRFPGRQFL